MVVVRSCPGSAHRACNTLNFFGAFSRFGLARPTSEKPQTVLTLTFTLKYFVTLRYILGDSTLLLSESDYTSILDFDSMLQGSSEPIYPYILCTWQLFLNDAYMAIN
jgi:hypothetical protein